jgi:tetratricopeptide (TPR) repeat protein
MLSLAISYSTSSLDPVGYHLVNVLLHLLNTLLVFQLAMQLFIRLGSGRTQLLSSIAALLFGIHPLHVESVAWVSGRKDLLYTCFYLLSLLIYIRYLDKRAIKYYLLSLLFFLFSLMSKGMAVTLTFSVIALDYFYKRDLFTKKVILEKIPFFILSLVFGIISIYVQQAQGATEIIKFGVFDRAVFACYGFTQYLIKFIFPYKLCGYYPYPDLKAANIPGAYYLSIIPALLSIVLFIYFLLIRPNRVIIFGILFFFINVMFVLQFFPVGSAVMADRYTYLSSFGIFFLAASGFGYLIQKFASARTLLIIVFIIYSLSLSAISSLRCSVWHDSYSFWNDVMVKYPHFYPAYNNLGEMYETEGRNEEAITVFSNSIVADKNNPNAFFHRGSIYGKSGRLKEAISDFTEAINVSPGFTQAYINRAIAKAMNQDARGALADLDSVLVKGKNESAYFNRGILKNDLKEYGQAISDFQEAININPSCTSCYYSLGLANYNDKQFQNAIKAFSTCLEMNPKYGNALYYRALCYIEENRHDSSCVDLQRASNLGIKAAQPLIEQHCQPGK